MNKINIIFRNATGSCEYKNVQVVPRIGEKVKLPESVRECMKIPYLVIVEDVIYDIEYKTVTVRIK